MKIALLELEQFSPFYHSFRFFLKKKKICMEKYEFPKKEIFFWSILVTEATKIISKFL